VSFSISTLAPGPYQVAVVDDRSHWRALASFVVD
jgi:hypothetical protein